MKATLCIRFEQPEIEIDTEVEWVLFEDTRLLVHERSPLNAIAMRMPDPKQIPVRTVLICPGESVFTTSVKIPSRQAATLRKALPYMLEEQLACVLEDTHMATAPLRDGDDVDVGVVAHGAMIAWIDSFHRAGLSPETIIPDFLLLPHRPGDLTVMPGPQRTLLRSDEFQGASLAPALLDRALGASLAEHGETIQGITVVSSRKEAFANDLSRTLAQDLRERLAVPLEHIEYEEPSLAVLGAEAIRQEEQEINLCQGGYRLQQRSSGEDVNYKPAAIGIAATLLLYFTATLGSGIYLDQKARVVEDEVRALYRDIFPMDRRVVSVRRQMQTHLRGGGAGSSAQFLPLLGRVSEVVRADPDASLNVTQVRFDATNGALSLELAAADMAALNKMQERLNEAGLDSRLISANERDEGVAGRIELRSG